MNRERHYCILNVYTILTRLYDEDVFLMHTKKND